MSAFSQFLDYPGDTLEAFSPSACGARGLFDLPYIGDGQHVHMGDLFLPKNRRQKRPVILHVHGGAWTTGSRAYTRRFCATLAAKGFAVWTVDFTPAEDSDLPTQVRDVIAAMRWIRTNASVYGLDPDCVFLSGDSAGAHLAMLACIVAGDATLRLIYGADEAPIRVKAFGLVSPVTDLRFVTDGVLPAARALRKKLFGEEIKESAYRFCSSIADVLRPQMHLPPVYIVSSEDDFYSAQSTDLHHVLNRRNVENVFRFFPGSAEDPLVHGFPVLNPTRLQSKTVIDEIEVFFRENI